MPRIWSRPLVFATAVVVAAFLGCDPKAVEPPAPGAQTKGTGQGMVEKEAGGTAGPLPWTAPYTDPVIARIGAVPVTALQLERYGKRTLIMTAEGHSQDAPLEERLAGYQRYLAVVMEGVARGLHREESFRVLEEINELSMYGSDFAKALPNEVTVDAEQLAARLPPDWVRLKLDFRAFRNQEEAGAAHASLRGGTPWDELDGTVKLRSGREAVTQWLYKGSGFFDAFDEIEVFELQTGDTYGPVRSGVGLAIVKVVEREDMDEAARNIFIQQQKDRIVQEKVGEVMAELGKSVVVEIDEGTLQECLVAEVVRGERPDRVIAHYGVERSPLRYRGMRQLLPYNLKGFLPAYPEESWALLMRGNVESLINAYEVGKHAKAEGRELNPRWQLELFEFRLSAVYDAALWALFQEAPGEVEEREVDRYIRENPDADRLPARMKIEYLYSPDRAVLEDNLAEYGATTAEAFGSPAVRERVRTHIISSASDVWGEVYAKAQAFPLGEVSEVFGAGMGFYVVKVLERDEDRRLSPEELRGSVRGKLMVEKKSEHVRGRLEQRLAELPVEILEAG